MITALDVAKVLVSKQNQEDSDLSNLKLQKLVWYCLGFYGALTGNKLFDDEIKAWEHGPVVPTLYHKLKKFGRNPVELEISPDLEEKFEKEQLEVIDEVAEVFGKYSAWKLRNMTHEEAPWLAHEAKAETVPFDEIVEYFKTRLN
tara:strand:+ start:402 stop:836 length:435 start_codon:yes stop_codon:yes gene_type:complete